ncbi:protein TolR [Micavibrio aeruginosavorus]|uniref:Protein TolR n=1 Tax=Micavibrio aeruginosavorus (strain ARL-13) TaxID=856793 RepID=G2KPK7_MICAA|nr:protein TolR [Micavibrio aeruginosavorus]AEP09507.1 protein TolR [Micavibrio aeruginosavorus ARL-13]
MGASLSSGGGSRSGRRGRSYRKMSDINVTPFVDVMLVLLIVFMVTAPLLTSGVPVDLPKSEAKQIADEDNKPLEISVMKDGKIFIGETEVERDRLIPLLSSMTNNDPDRRIFIRGDQGLPYGDVMDVIGSVNKAGFRKVALISNPSK